MQEIAESFTVPQSADRVWTTFQDVPKVVTCMPGLDYLGEPEPGTHAGKVKMKLGPINANFEGKATFTRVDPDGRTAELEASGADKKAGSQARADISYRIEEMGADEARVTLAGTIKLTGALANLGRSSIVKDVAKHLTDQFAANLRAMLAEQARAPIEPVATSGNEVIAAAAGEPAPPRPAPKAAEAISGFALFKAIVTGWLRRLGGSKS
ncbi:SRPBCC family protein [Microbaculum marinum]|uniref:SRPBCC family protein n=1 Tax=Microbaculum marinum TaxID=1764581 RepID=A0AAW9RYW6_9HYPH